MPFTDLLFAWLVRSAVVGTVILLIGSGAVLTCRQPVRRLRIIELVLAGCLLAPFLGLVPGYPQLAVVAWRSAETKPQEMPLPAAIGPEFGPPVIRPSRFSVPDLGAPLAPDTIAADAPVHAWGFRQWIVTGYLAGVLVAIGWWLVGLIGLVRILRTAEPAPPRCRELLAEISAGRGNRVRLLTSRRLKQPFASAWGRAVIILPHSVCGDERTLRWCLAHEWAHVARHDFRAWLLAALARALFFYQPLVWWLRRQLRLCQDFLADAQAAGQASQVEDYAEFLTALAAKGRWRPAALGLGMRPGKSELYRRVIMLLKHQPLEGRAPRSWTVSATAAAVVLAALTAAISFAPRAVAEEEQAAKGSDAGPAQASIAQTNFSLPAFLQLCWADVRRDYHLSVDQENKLQSISQDYVAHMQELRKSTDQELAKLPPQRRSEKRDELREEWWRKETAAGRKKIEKVLTAEQVAAYKHDMMGSDACRLWDLQQHDVVPAGLSPQQGEQIKRLEDDAARAAAQDIVEKSRQLLAVLSAEQRRKLMASFPAVDLAVPFAFVPARNESATSYDVDWARPPLLLAMDSRGARLGVAMNLTEDTVRKELHLTAQQQESVLAIAKEFQADAQHAFKIYPATNKALDKLSAEEQKAKRAECERKLKEIASDAIRQIEAVLGPQHWAALKRKAEEERELEAAERLTLPDEGKDEKRPGALGPGNDNSRAAAGQLAPPEEMLRQLSLSSQQRGKLRESAEAIRAVRAAASREAGEKALAVLTAPQRKKLEEYLDQQGW